MRIGRSTFDSRASKFFRNTIRTIPCFVYMHDMHNFDLKNHSQNLCLLKTYTYNMHEFEMISGESKNTENHMMCSQNRTLDG
jgi:hypothetical protein